MFRLLRGMVKLVLGSVMLLGAGLLWLNLRLPDTFLVCEGQPFMLAQMPWLEPLLPAGAAQAQSAPAGSSYNVTLSLLGRVPVKTVRAVVSDRRAVTVCGTPFGVKMFAEGAMIVGFSDIHTQAGYENPAKSAGLRLGDNILRMDGKNTHSNDDLAKIIQSSEGRKLEVVYERDGMTGTAQLIPVQDPVREEWQAGMWVRDSSAGIGTLTFVDNSTGVYGGLGHPINDSDTGRSVTLRSGEIAPVTIVGLEKGKPGDPGELKGRFTGGPSMGNVSENGPAGVYGHINRIMRGTDLPVAHVQEVRRGPARVLTTIDGSHPRWYKAEIERVSLAETDPNRNLVVCITDPELLEQTGGILQGMSGSPIEQNGRLVGAVTHVLIHDSTRGYGIFAENMLKTADSAA